VDPTHAHDKPAALDVQLLQRGAALAHRLGGELHALHVYSVPAPVGVIGDAYIASAALPPVEQSIEQARKACLGLATASGLAADRVHFRVGVPAKDIVAQAREIDASLVLMGAVSRRRLERWFVGSTAEAALDRLPCNVWVEKPGASA
jgi:universal stress protein E